MIRALAVDLCAASLLTGCSGSQVGASDDRLPDITLADFDGGESVDLGEFKGPGVMSVWASWCGPRREDAAGDINGQGAFPVLRGLPCVAFVDEDGIVTHVEAVIVGEAGELVAMAEEHLGVQL